MNCEFDDGLKAWGVLLCTLNFVNYDKKSDSMYGDDQQSIRVTSHENEDYCLNLFIKVRIPISFESKV